MKETLSKVSILIAMISPFMKWIINSWLFSTSSTELIRCVQVDTKSIKFCYILWFFSPRTFPSVRVEYMSIQVLLIRRKKPDATFNEIRPMSLGRSVTSIVFWISWICDLVAHYLATYAMCCNMKNNKCSLYWSGDHYT